MVSARSVVPGIYRHYKGKLYSVIGVVRHSETEELMVLYIPLYHVPEGGPHESSVPTQMTVRPLENFAEEVNLQGQKYRFTRIN